MPMNNRSVYSADHELFRQTARRFYREELEPHIERWEDEGIIPRELWRKAGAQGLLCCGIPEAYGGPGGDFYYNMISSEEIGYAIGGGSCSFALQSDITAYYLLHHASEALKQRWLPGMVSGEIISAIAMTEPGAGSDLQGTRTTAVRDGDHYVINGTKRFITSGQNSSVVIVTAKTDEALRHKGISAFIVEKGTPGLTVGHVEDKMGLRASDTTDLIFEDCRVPVENMLGEEGQGFAIAMTGLDGGRIGIAAQSVGVARASLDEAVKYAKQREQFGQSISKFQGLRWMVADMATEIEAARQLVLSAAAMKDRGEPHSQQASMAKLFASEMVQRVTGKAIQIHGGYGFTKDYPVERLYRDARVFTIYEGTSEIQRIVISNHVFKDKRQS